MGRGRPLVTPDGEQQPEASIGAFRHVSDLTEAEKQAVDTASSFTPSKRLRILCLAQASRERRAISALIQDD